MSYEKAAFTWAERRLSLPKGSVIGLDFGMRSGGYCETCSYEMVGVDVSYRDKSGKNRSEFIDLGYESFTGVLGEILEESL